MERDLFIKNASDITLARKRSIAITGQNKKFKIQISKYEFCTNKEAKDIDGYTIYVYSPILLAFEKLRSICQQMVEYPYRASTATARPRDFFDIFVILNHFNISLFDSNNLTLIKEVFKAKQVPLELLKYINKYQDFHHTGFSSLQDTIKPGVKLKSFDFYFEHVIQLAKELSQALGVK